VLWSRNKEHDSAKFAEISSGDPPFQPARPAVTLCSHYLAEVFMASLSNSLVKKLLDGRYAAALATQNGDGSIHVVAVWFLFDGSSLYIATSGRSRKARNVQSNPHVSLMIDSRDVAASCGINVFGTAEILTGDQSRSWVARIHHKYLSSGALADPKVGPVFAALDDVTLKITPSSVISWDMRQTDQQFFGGAFEKNPGYLLPLEW
jgi:PPOX class probable F420-dependent enzyme